MNLAFSPEEEAFRQEARSWLEANVPKTPLVSGDTREGGEGRARLARSQPGVEKAVMVLPGGDG